MGRGPRRAGARPGRDRCARARYGRPAVRGPCGFGTGYQVVGAARGRDRHTTGARDNCVVSAARAASGEGGSGMTNDEILQGLFDNTLVGNAPAVKDLTNEGLAQGMNPESLLYDALIPSLEE